MAKIQHRDIGDVWVPTATFSVSGTPTDPTALTVYIKEPDGTITTHVSPNAAVPVAPVVRDSAGVFHINIDLDAAGYWNARFEGTGAATAAEDHELIVDPSPFYADSLLTDRALAGLAETKAWLEMKDIDTSDDLQIVRLINAASEAIHEVADREFRPYPANSVAPDPDNERIFDLYWPVLHGRTVEIGDAAAISAVEIADEDGTLLETVVSTDYTTFPRVLKPGEPITSIRLSTDVTLHGSYLLTVAGDWGFPSVPEDIKHACIDTVAFWRDRDVEHYRQDLSRQEGTGGGVTIMQVTARPMILRLPPEAWATARDYRRTLVA